MSSPELSHAIDLFLHKDRTSFFFDDSIAAGSIAPLEPVPPLAPTTFHWDLKTTCMPMLPAFQYISRKLSQRDLSIHLIISDHEPFVIPVWPLPRRSQLLLSKIVRRACSKFSLSPSFLTALAASSSKKDLPKIFDTHRPDSYIVRRSIVQHEVVFTGEGLTLLNIDHVYTFKQLLCTLSKKDWVTHARDTCLSSCVQLLHRINETYTEPKISKGYLARAYREIELKEQVFDEVYTAYNANYCTASIHDVAIFEPDYNILSSKASDDWETISPVTELPDTSSSDTRIPSPDLISPVATVDLSTLKLWETAEPDALGIISPLTVTYPKFNKPSELPSTPSDNTDPGNYDWPSPPKTRETQKSDIPPPLRCSQTWSTSEDPHPPETTETRDFALLEPPLRKTVESWNSEALQSPMRWLESWSTVPPSALCENCHDVVNVSRRFTLA
ncbi:hypothetical protein MMC28_001511 [Mycoblastus sanguinarius]|nr:hypothetical protein [Mycoblastus sanguinarius]